ncbi:MAG: DNA cytosine methyltransferase [Verrucomicrobiales bacterium]
MSKPKPTAIDLFSGCGGLTCGLKQAGFRVIGAVEINELAAKTFKKNHRNVDVFKDDIRELVPEDWMAKLGLKAGELDLLAGCPPCQGFSTLRTKNGAKRNRDRRNGLVRQIVRLVEVFRPKAILMENVPGLRSKEVFREFIRELKALEYLPQEDVHDVSNFNVPQRRKRLVLAAGRGFEIPFAREAVGLSTVRTAIESLPKAGESGDRWHDYPEQRTPLMLERIRATPKNGGSRSSWPDHLWLKCHRETDGFKDVYGRMKWDSVAPTITGGCFNPSRGRFLHPEEDRGITLREAALLQSFPEDYKFAETATKQEVALMIGNAIPPEFVRRQGLEIRKAIKRARGEGLLA